MIRAALARRVVHIAVGGGAFLLPLLAWQTSLCICMAAALFNLFVLSRRPWLARADGRGAVGLTAYPLVIALLLLLFRDDYAPVQAAWVAMAVGDGLAPLLAVRGTEWAWNTRKSWVGSGAAFCVCALVLLALLPPPLALAAAAAGCIAESLPLPWDDNLSVPLAAASALCVVRWSCA